MFVGRIMPPRIETVTDAVVSARLGSELAWIVAVPGTTPVTGTLTLLVFDAMVTVAGTVAKPVLSELRLTITPPDGAGDERFSVMFCTEPCVTIRLGWAKLRLPVTCTSLLSPVNPVDDALIVADP